MNGALKRKPWDESHELEKMIFNALSNEDGLTDVEMAEKMKSMGITFYSCRNLCLQLAAKGLIKRERIQGKPLVNRIAKGETYKPEQLILRLLNDEGGLTDKELSERLKGQGVPYYACLQLCFQLAIKGLIKRDRVQGKPLVNRIIKVEQ